MRPPLRRLGGGTAAVLGIAVLLGDAARAAVQPVSVAREYVRDHRAALGLDSDDLGRLALTDRYTSLDGVTHVVFTPRTRGVDVYGRFLVAHVAADGRVIDLAGEAAPDVELSSAEPAIAGPPGAKLVAFPARGGARLAWQARAGDDEVVLDAGSGETLSRRSLVSDANAALIYDLHPDRRVSPRTVDLGADPSWIDRSEGGTKLAGNNAHATQFREFTDDVEEIAQNPDGNWTFPAQFYTHAECPAFGCTWNSADGFATRMTNSAQTTTQSFYFANRYHDHLLAPPIGFDEASRNFEQVNSTGQGLGGDAIEVRANHAIRNNASFVFAVDGGTPAIELGRVSVAWDVRTGDTAEVVYHEYGHGLVGRLVGAGTNSVSGVVGKALNEAWADWFAEDFVVAEGLVHDTSAPGEVVYGAYSNPAWRTEAMDCAVGAPAGVCPGHGTAGTGGYTFSDFGKIIDGAPFEEHANGEIWSQTLWDLRTRIGAPAARCIVAGGLRLSTPSPGFIEARDAILQSALVVGVSQQAVWEVFAARGMGADASGTTSPPTDGFAVPDLPPQAAPTGSCGVDITPPPPPPPPSPPPPPAGGGGPPPGGPTVASQLTADLKSSAKAVRKLRIGKLVKRRRFAITGLDALGPGRFTLVLKRGALTIAKGSRAAGRAGRYSLTARLTVKGRKLLGSARRVKATLVLSFKPVTGVGQKRSAKLVLRR